MAYFGSEVSHGFRSLPGYLGRLTVAAAHIGHLMETVPLVRIRVITRKWVEIVRGVVAPARQYSQRGNSCSAGDSKKTVDYRRMKSYMNVSPSYSFTDSVAGYARGAGSVMLETPQRTLL